MPFWYKICPGFWILSIKSRNNINISLINLLSYWLYVEVIILYIYLFKYNVLSKPVSPVSSYYCSMSLLEHLKLPVCLSVPLGQFWIRSLVHFKLPQSKAFHSLCQIPRASLVKYIMEPAGLRSALAQALSVSRG